MSEGRAGLLVHEFTNSVKGFHVIAVSFYYDRRRRSEASQLLEKCGATVPQPRQSLRN